MQTDWPPLLAQFGARLAARGDVVFEQAPQPFATLAATLTITPLAPYGVLEIHGPDSAKFLQGQLTCDVRDIGPTRSTPGAYCTQKGRMSSSFQLLQREDDRLWLRMRADLIENTARTLGKYSVFSKAKLVPRTDIVGFGLHGPGATDLLRQLFGDAPAGQDDTLLAGDALLLRRDTAGEWFECWLPATAAGDLWQRSTAQASAAGTEYWRWLVLRSGFGEISAATAELFIPQMLNYHLNGAVNFKKGCYTGQEIVARTHYRGQVKRHVQLASYSAAVPPEPAAEVLGAAGNAIGNVVDSVLADDGYCELLAVVADAEGTAGMVRLGDELVALAPLALPYAIN
jgi:folate-binding protein YgfZ